MHIAAVLTRYSLPERFIHFLDVMPLIEMVWADGKNQWKEREIVRDFLHEKISAYRSDFGFEVIAEADLRQVLDFFLKQRPDADMLAELRECARERILKRGDDAYWNALTDRCMDIAAACALRYPYRNDERIVTEEKQLLRELITTPTR
ncbi:MAG: hypothetical protein H6999_00230 [Hahellaceae bacterium]|nr:hypothetical protein [Hahellaceae bacterium]MCP5168177.1 hypothetical protein [Hahellaceae bacterium]